MSTPLLIRPLVANAREQWYRLLPQFLSCHQTPLNVALHLITTPLGLLAMLLLVHTMLPAAAASMTIVYLLALGVFLPAGLWLLSAVVLIALWGLASLLGWGMFTSLGLLGAAWVLQELAHRVTGEHTLQSTYRDSRHWFRDWLEHTFFLLPLVLAAPGHLNTSLLAFLVPRNRVFLGHLDDGEYGDQLERIRDFVARQPLPPDTTAHWWQQELTGDIREAFDTLAQAAPLMEMFRDPTGPRQQVELLQGMNEIYVAAPQGDLSSDQVFYTPHIDGPWACYPFVWVYRCMLAVNQNSLVHTRFPLNGSSIREPQTYTLTTGDALAFDYNREPHYITRDAGSAAHRRISLKLHYLVYPDGLGAYGRGLGRLSTWYNSRARRLFLQTIHPDGLLARAQAAGILMTTRTFEFITSTIGWGNLLYVVVLAIISQAVRDLRVLLYGTSFVHYFMYLAVFSDRRHVSFGRFKRNALFFKSLALIQLAGWYLYVFEFNPLSLVLLIAGFGLSAAATARLGLNRTFYGAELGHCPPVRIRRFPYGWLPHPMILGAIIGLLGCHLLAPFRELLPWLVPLHIAGYLAVLAQELGAGRTEPQAVESALRTSPETSQPQSQTRDPSQVGRILM